MHPQQWREDLDLAGKRIVVIGSGSTAATLNPAIVRGAEHVTMLQRSPSYFLAPPLTHELAVTLRSLDIPEDWTHEILRRAYSAQFNELARLSHEAPDELHTFLMESVRPLLPEGFDIDKHFTPRYRPWQQRIAIVPEGDPFPALREGKASIVTDTIETFTETGIRVGSGEELEADVVVTATGFDLLAFGDVDSSVDGEPVAFPERVTWRGIMTSGVPNMAYVFGYFRHSWTLRVDLVCDLVIRMPALVQDRGATMVVPTLRLEDAGMQLRPWSDPENSTPATSCAPSTSCPSRATGSRGPTCSSTRRRRRSCRRPISRTGRSSTADLGGPVTAGRWPAGWATCRSAGLRRSAGP